LVAPFIKNCYTVRMRTQIVDRFQTFLNTYELNEAYGVIRTGGESGKFEELTFCKARVLDGTVKVYGPKFILVKYNTAYRTLPQNDHAVFTSEADAFKFLKAAFVDLDFDTAMNVPRKGAATDGQVIVDALEY